MNGSHTDNGGASELSIERRYSKFIAPILRPGRVLPITVISVGLWCLASWFWADVQRDSRELRLIEREREVAENTAQTISANIGLGLAHLRSIPAMLSKDPDVLSVLSRIGPDVQPSILPEDRRREVWLADPAMKNLSRRFTEILVDVGVNQIWVMNAAGDCIVSGGFPPGATATGVNYADRDYFRAGLLGQNGRQFAVGRTTNMPGLYYSSPISEKGRFLGIVTVKVEMGDLARMVRDPDVFVSDENGVVILAGDKQWIMHSLPGAKIAQVSVKDLDDRYKRTTFETVRLEPVDLAGQSRIVRWNGEPTPYVLAVAGRVDDIVSVHVLRSLGGLKVLRRDRLWSFISLAMTGSSLLVMLMGGAIYLRGNIEHGREMGKANADLAKLNAILAQQANTDPLTGCANRRQFMAILDIEWQRGGRYACPFSVALLDLDHFKQINDLHGHAIGDQALCHFVNVAKAVLRSSDILGRLGGDEFAILMPQTEARAAVKLAERIRKTVSHSPVEAENGKIPLAVSVGVAQWREGSDETLEELLGRADAALYAAKDCRAGI